MKKSIVATSLIFANLVFAASSQAAAVQTRFEGDILYGQGAVAASAAQPYEVTGPIQHRSEGYLLWDINSQQAAGQQMGAVRLADDRRMATDLIYGS